MRVYVQQGVLAYIVEFVEIEKCSAARHLLCRKPEIVCRSVRVFNTPLLIIRVEYCEQVFSDCRRVIAFVAIEVE